MIRGALMIGAWVAFHPGYAQWQTLGAGIVDDGGVRSLLYDSVNTKLYVFGHFAQAGGLTVNGTAYWANEEWHPMGQGVPNPLIFPVMASGLIGDSVLISGSFHSVGGLADTRQTALWDGVQWRSIGPGGSDGAFFGMTANEDGMTIAGIMDSIAGVEINHMARYANGAWHSICAYPSDQGFINYMALVKYQGRYIAGGNVNVPGLREIGWLDGDTLRQLGPGLLGDPWVNDLVIYRNDLYVGGEFYAPANAGSGVMKWDGVSFSDPFPGVQYVGMVHDMDVRNGELYISGQVIVPGVPGYFQLARFDGERICLFGKNMNVVFRDIAATETELYVAPNAVIPILFGDTPNRILRYDLDSSSDTCIAITTGIAEASSHRSHISFGPNPFSDRITVTPMKAMPLNCEFQLRDLTGKIIWRNTIPAIPLHAAFEIELPPLPESIYYALIVSGEGIIIEHDKMVRME